MFWEVGVATGPEQGLGGTDCRPSPEAGDFHGIAPLPPTLHTSLIWASLWPVGLTQST